MSKVALNASIRAAHLADEGKTLSVISQEISNVSKNIGLESEALKSESSDLAKNLSLISFYISQAILQTQTLNFFLTEQENNALSEAEQQRHFGKSISEISKLLTDRADASVLKAASCILTLQKAFTSFEVIAEALGKILLTIQFSYVTGKTLSAKISSGEKFAILLTDLISLSESAREEIMNLKKSVEGVKRTVSNWESQTEVVEGWPSSLVG